MPESILY